MSFRNEFERARDFLILHRADYRYAYGQFQWPRLERFNWALDYFDPMAEGNSKIGLWLVDEDGHEKKFSFSELAHRSNQVANFLRSLGLAKGDSLFMLIENEVAMWELLLAAMKIGAVIVPNSPLLSQQELKDRLDREKVKMITTTSQHTGKFDITASGVIPVVVDQEVPGWVSYQDAYRESAEFEPHERTLATDPLFRYFTSSSSAKPRIVEHSQAGFTVGHLSTMFWIGLRPGDIHLGINSPGWSMHDWNTFIAPWNAEATIFIFRQKRFNARMVLDVLEEYPITTFCAPPTVWRLLAREDMESFDVHLRETVSTGEPLAADIISRVHSAWNLFVREGYGQTETSTLIGVPPEGVESLGTMGRPLPGYQIVLLNPEGEESDVGEISVDLAKAPWGIMLGVDSSQRYFRTGDFAFVDSLGNFTFSTRADGLFKSSDYRISPHELEFVLREYPAIREVVVIPSPDPIREAVPKALITVTKGVEPTKELALDIMNFARLRLSPFKRIRRVEFMDIPKNAAGEVLRSELIQREKEKMKGQLKSPYEFWEEDSKIVVGDTWAQELP